MELNFNELRELVTTLSQTDISELTLKGTDFELTLRKQGAIATVGPSAAVTGSPEQPIAVSVLGGPPSDQHSPNRLSPHAAALCRLEFGRDYVAHGGDFLSISSP